jgi:hypothetical protein
MEILQLSKYEERSYRETPNREGFVNYGDDNLFPQYLVDLYHSSATHNALVTSIAMMIYGEGFDANDLEGRLAFDQWNLNDELRKACLDFKIQGGFALEVNWSLDRTTIANVSHLPFENVRSGFVNEDEKVEYYYYSKDWSDKRRGASRDLLLRRRQEARPPYADYVREAVLAGVVLLPEAGLYRFD